MTKRRIDSYLEELLPICDAYDLKLNRAMDFRKARSIKERIDKEVYKLKVELRLF